MDRCAGRRDITEITLTSAALNSIQSIGLTSPNRSDNRTRDV